MFKTKFGKTFWLLTVALLALAAWALLPTATALAAEIIVDTTGEIGADGYCSLREAIQAAETDLVVDACGAGSGHDTIRFAPSISGTIVLTGTLPPVTTDITIDGPGAETLAISGDNAYRVLDIWGTGALTMTAVTVRDGNQPQGGAILSQNYLYLDSVVLRDNVSHGTASGQGGVGGALFLGGTTNATLTGTLVINNVADCPGGCYNSDGGGIYLSHGTLHLINSQVLSNTAPEGGGGGGILVNASSAWLHMEGGEVGYNTTGQSGGGIRIRSGNAIITGTVIHHNEAEYYGAGLFSNSPNTVRLVDVDVLSNTINLSGRYGAGLGIGQTARLTVVGGKIAYNSILEYGEGGGANNSGGHLVMTGTQVISNTGGSGGGLWTWNGSLTLTNTVIADNAARYGGGIYSRGDSLIKVTGGRIVSNTLSGFSAPGGGIYVYYGGDDLILDGPEIAYNTAAAGSGLYAASARITTTAPLTVSGDVYFNGDFFAASAYPLHITGDLAIHGGIFDAPSDFVLGGTFDHVGGTYRQTQDVNGSTAVEFPKTGGVFIDAAGLGDLGSTDVQIEAGVDCTAVPGETVQRCYTITPTNTSNVSATVTLYYRNTELGDHSCQTVVPYRIGGTWNKLTLDPGYDDDGRMCGSSPYSVRVHQLDQFGDLVLASTLLEINDVEIPEGNSGTATAVFTVTRSGGVYDASSVTYATSDGTATAGEDYAAVSPTVLNFTAGETTKTISVTVYGDTDFEWGETFYVNLTNPMGAGFKDDVGQGMIANDDPGSTGSGPGGVGIPDGLTPLELWLKADAGVTTDYWDRMTAWDDQSGNMHQATSTYGPYLVDNARNGQSVLNFGGYNTVSLGDLSASFPTSATLFVFTTITDTDNYALYTTSGSWPGYYWNYSSQSRLSAFRTTYIDGYPASFPTGGAYIYTLKSSDANYELFQNGVSYGAQAGSYVAGTDHRIGYYLSGDIGEVIIYSSEINTAKHILVENYLSAKYNVTVATDVYDGDTSANGDFDLNVAGIGREADGDNPEAGAAGIIVEDVSFLQDSGDYLVFGHNTPVNDRTTADVPATGDWDGVDDARWARHWYFDRTDAGTTGGLVDITFDYGEGAMDSQMPDGDANNYRLLRRANPTGQFEDITSTCTGSTAYDGDQVTFYSVDITCLGSNFTLGTIDAVASPTALTLQGLAARGGLWAMGLLAAVGLAIIYPQRKRR